MYRYLFLINFLIWCEITVGFIFKYSFAFQLSLFPPITYPLFFISCNPFWLVVSNILGSLTVKLIRRHCEPDLREKYFKMEGDWRHLFWQHISLILLTLGVSRISDGPIIGSLEKWHPTSYTILFYLNSFYGV